MPYPPQSVVGLLTNPTIQGTINPGSGLTMPAFISGDISLGANKLKTTNLLVKELSASLLVIKDAADSAYKGLQLNELSVYTSISLNDDNSTINAPNNDTRTSLLKARDNGVGLVEVARLQGAVDPYLQLTLPPVHTQTARPGTPVTGHFVYNSTSKIFEHYDGAAWIPHSNGIGIFGDGSDGDVTISGATTLTSDMFYNNLTVNSTLNTAGFRVFVKDKLTIGASGIIQNNGAAGVDGGAGAPVGTLSAGSAGGAWGAGTDNHGGKGGGGGGVIVIAAKTVVNGGVIQANGGLGGDGVAGAVGGGQAGTAGTNITVAMGGAGGAGGACDTGTYAGGAGGTVTAPAATVSPCRSLPMAIALKDGTTQLTPGAGGGGGASGAAGADAGGGGGGGGGLVIIIYSSATWTTEQALAGAKGNKAGGGADGVAGSAGVVVKISNA